MVNLSDVRKTDEAGAELEGYVTADGQNIDDTYCNNLASSCLQKCIEHADWVINDIRKEYDEDMQLSGGMVSQDKLTQPYPLSKNPVIRLRTNHIFIILVPKIPESLYLNCNTMVLPPLTVRSMAISHSMRMVL